LAACHAAGLLACLLAGQPSGWPAGRQPPRMFQLHAFFSWLHLPINVSGFALI